MLIITQTALELGFLYALIAMALFLSYRILDANHKITLQQPSQILPLP